MEGINEKGTNLNRLDPWICRAHRCYLLSFYQGNTGRKSAEQSPGKSGYCGMKKKINNIRLKIRWLYYYYAIPVLEKLFPTN